MSAPDIGRTTESVPESAPESESAAGTESGAVAGQWRRLDPKTYLPTALITAGLLLVTIVAFVVTLFAGAIWIAITPGSITLVFLLICVAEGVKYVTTRYRLTDERFEMSTGLASKKNVSIPRERIRTVDITANILYRIFGLAQVAIGTGQATGAGNDEISLDAITRHDADALRRELLEGGRRGAAPASTHGVGEPVGASAGGSAVGSAGGLDSTNIIQLSWSWLKYAPLTTMSFVAIAAVLGILYKPLDAMGVNPMDIWFVRDGVTWVRGSTWVALVVAALVAVVVLCVVAAIGSLLYYIAAWWGYRLDYENGIFRVRRGLLTTTSISIEGRRLRGVEVAEPMLLRWGGGARLNAIATGLGPRKSGGGENEQKTPRHYLVPPSPRAVAHDVAAKVLGDAESPTDRASLRTHPIAALRRRLVRALMFAIGCALVPIILALTIPPAAFVFWPLAIAFLVVVLVAGIGFAIASYNSLGHALVDRYLVIRSGGAIRHTVALRRSGVIGWRIRQSFFQRRSGLATVSATTAAGEGIYKVRDVPTGVGLSYADNAVPGLLDQFLER